MKYFVDIGFPNGTWKEGLLPLAMFDASALVGAIRAQHPHWRVGFTSVEEARP